jgi:hypothetical protein
MKKIKNKIAALVCGILLLLLNTTLLNAYPITIEACGHLFSTTVPDNTSAYEAARYALTIADWLCSQQNNDEDCDDSECIID